MFVLMVALEDRSCSHLQGSSSGQQEDQEIKKGLIQKIKISSFLQINISSSPSLSSFSSSSSSSSSAPGVR